MKRSGWKAAFKAFGQVIHAKLFPTRWDFDLVPKTLEDILAQKASLTIVQIGANVGKTENDQLWKFFTKHCVSDSSTSQKIRAILIEPVSHLYDQLARNYAGYQGLSCLRAAVAECEGTKTFYRLREGLDLAACGLPPYAEQLGSFLRENMASLAVNDPKNPKLLEFINANIIEELIPCLTLEKILEQNGMRELDFLQVDTEGYDYHILRSIDFTRHAPRYINYERIHLHTDEAPCRRLLLRHGYVLHDHGQDTFCLLGGRRGLGKQLADRLYNAWLDAIN